jgi:hypothetical protein
MSIRVNGQHAAEPVFADTPAEIEVTIAGQ